MKRNIIFSLIGVALGGLLLSSCSGGKPESVTAVVAGPNGQPAAVVVKYAKAVSAQSVTADAYSVAGQEIESVFITDKDITAAPAKSECDASKHAACDSAKHDCCKAAGEQHNCGKAAGEQHDCGKAAGEKHDCGKAAGEKHDCGKAAGEQHDCGKAVGEKSECDTTKVCHKAEEAKACKGPESVDGQYVVIVLKKNCAAHTGEKHDCGKAACDSTKHDCGKAQKCELAVPAITVEQVKEIKYVDGGAVKAWGKAFPATKAVPCMKKGHRAHHHGGEACKGEKSECDAQHKDCPKEATK